MATAKNVDRAVQRLKKISDNITRNRLIEELWPIAQLNERRPLPKWKIGEAIETLLASPFYMNGLSYELIRQETCRKPLPRFPTSTIISWLEAMSVAGKDTELCMLVRIYEREVGIKLPAADLLRWGMRGLQTDNGRKLEPAILLLLRPECRTHPMLNLEKVGARAIAAAKAGDPGCGRLLALLLENLPTKAGRLGKRSFSTIADTIAGALPDMLGTFLCMAKERLSPKTFRDLSSHVARRVQFQEHERNRELWEILRPFSAAEIKS